jgi:hypothetical protein
VSSDEHDAERGTSPGLAYVTLRKVASGAHTWALSASAQSGAEVDMREALRIVVDLDAELERRYSQTEAASA